jgi:phage-related protein
LKGVFSRVLGKLGDFVKPFRKVFANIKEGVKDAFRGLGSFVSRIFEGVKGTIKSAINFFIRGINTLIRAFNKISGKLSKLPGVPDVKIPEIPKLASGGVTRGGTLAEIGEAGREAVLPLTRAVYTEIARGIVQAMQPMVRGRTTQVAAVGAGGTVIHKTVVEKIVIQTPDGSMPDATATAVKMARVLERRGGGPRQ